MTAGGKPPYEAGTPPRDELFKSLKNLKDELRREQDAPWYTPTKQSIRSGTLIDSVIRETYRQVDKSPMLRYAATPPLELRKSLLGAKRFILDDSMSSFLADISTSPFKGMTLTIEQERGMKRGAIDSIVRRNVEALTSIRHSAIPPFKSTWVEFSVPPMFNRLLELRKGEATRGFFGEDIDPQDVIPVMGWHFQMDQDATTGALSIYSLANDDKSERAFCLPFSFIYRTDDMEMEAAPYGERRFFRIDHAAATIGTGILVEDKRMGVINHRLEMFEAGRQIADWSGAPWMQENPVTMLSSIPHLGKPNHYFHPWEYAGYCADDNYTKKTSIWCGNGFVMPEKCPAPHLGEPDNRIHFASPADDRADIRSAAPMGFTIAVFRANAPACYVAALDREQNKDVA